MIITHDSLDKVMDDPEQKDQREDKIHPWHICPIGKHFIKKHIEHLPPSKKHPKGQKVERKEHCALNPSKKDILSFDEIQALTKKYFHKLSGPPKAGDGKYLLRCSMVI